MSATGEEDVLFQRASGHLISQLKSILPQMLWKRRIEDPARRQVHRWAHPRVLDRIITCIEPFQEDPQLLDTSLKEVLPQLVDAYLEYLLFVPAQAHKAGFLTLQHAICRLLYQFCKVRGEKIVLGFLNNEPRFLEPILQAFESIAHPNAANDQENQSTAAKWQEKYVLLLWLSHLMLAPFDLASISSQSLPVKVTTLITLPENTPGIAAHVVPLCIEQMQSASKERNAAALLLVKLCLRPDMRKIGLLDSVLRWALSQTSTFNAEELEIHQYLGIICFLSGLAAAANTDEIGHFIPHIFKTCQKIVTSDAFEPVRASAIVRKFVIKTFRNLIVLSLQWDSSIFDATTALEEVIEYLLQALADTDTPVRYAASKALSIITLKLDLDMALEVVEAVLDSFMEDVFEDSGQRNLSAVNPLRWHGLTLTLGHVLYRRIPQAEQLPKIINTLLMAMNFEQRSTTGASIGTNVRDAACFGIWALSRRYKTRELLSVTTEEIYTSTQACHSNITQLNIPQILAVELLVAACLDPAGNIRRGSSAALQELIGRHPDTVKQGISLVQVVDYHAVALRSRAIEEIGFTAADLDPLYLKSLLKCTQGWRGIGAVDAPSRQSAASLIGSLTSLLPYPSVQELILFLLARLKKVPLREVEDRHGLIFTLAAVVSYLSPRLQQEVNVLSPSRPLEAVQILTTLMGLWSSIENDFGIKPIHYTDRSLRPELTSLAYCAFLTSLSKHTDAVKDDHKFEKDMIPLSWVLENLQFCMRRREGPVLAIIPTTAYHFANILSHEERESIIQRWLQILHTVPSAASRPAGLMLALGAISRNLTPGSGPWMSIVQAITVRCTSEFVVETRVLALKAMKLHLTELDGKSHTSIPGETGYWDWWLQMIGKTLYTALNDYTVTERGDEGSLVRLEALTTVKLAWSKELFLDENEYGIQAATLRLSLEKLDRVRSVAASVLDQASMGSIEPGTDQDPSSYQYFRKCLSQFSTSTKLWARIATLEGYISSAGMGSEAVVQASRHALANHVATCAIENAYQTICNTLLQIFIDHLGNDRIILPLLEVSAYLFDAGIITHPRNTEFKWRKLFFLVQKAHFKSTIPQKMLLAIHIYRGLADVDIIRKEVLAKLCSMLLHPFAKVRVAAAETLFVITEERSLTMSDWSSDAKLLKDKVASVKHQVVPAELK